MSGIFSKNYSVKPFLLSFGSTVSEGTELNLISWYRHERELANSGVSDTWRQQSEEVCAYLVQALGYTPDVTTDSTTPNAPPPLSGDVGTDSAFAE